MINFTTRRRLHLFAGSVLLLAAGACQAQWMWIDAKGMKQASDRPPPASVPAKDILRAPMHTVIEDKPAADGATAAAPAPAASRSPTLAEREADYRKRMADKAEQENKQAAQDDLNDRKAMACRAAQSNKAQLDAGGRLRSGSGRAEFMSETERGERAAQAALVIREMCK